MTRFGMHVVMPTLMVGLAVLAVVIFINYPTWRPLMLACFLLFVTALINSLYNLGKE